MIKYDEFRRGLMLRLDKGDTEMPMPGCKRIPKGVYQITAIYKGLCNTSKPEHDMVAEVMKISKDGLQIGKRRYAYAIGFFMQNATISTQVETV